MLATSPACLSPFGFGTPDTTISEKDNKDEVERERERGGGGRKGGGGGREGTYKHLQ